MSNIQKLELLSGGLAANVIERRKAKRYHLLTAGDLLATGPTELDRVSVLNMSWTGLAVSVRQYMKPGRTITVRFRFQGEEQVDVTESLTARIVWRTGDNMGLEFDPPLTTGSPALKQAPFLVAHLMMREA